MSKYIFFRVKKLGISYLFEKRTLFVIAVLLVLSALSMILSTGMGTMKISPVEVVKVIFGAGEEMHKLVVNTLRLPRIITSFMVGASLAIAGAILQGIIRNPLASPDVIGITGGAGVAAVAFFAAYIDPNNNSLVISIHWLPLISFAGAFIVALLVYSLAWKGGVSPIRLVLIGIGISAAMKALTTIIIIFGPFYLATKATLWLTGSVYGSTWQNVSILLPWVVVLFLISLILARRLNVQELGDELAASVGSHVQRHRFLLLLISAALAGSAVAVAGGIGFVGLIAPHIGRKLVGSAFGGLLPVSALIGGLIVLLADLVARTAFSPLDIPAGIFTAAIGAPYFIFLLIKSRNVQ